MKRSRIKSVTVEISDQKRPPDQAEQIAEVHLRFIRRRMEELGLSRRQKCMVLDGIIARLKSQAGGRESGDGRP